MRDMRGVASLRICEMMIVTRLSEGISKRSNFNLELFNGQLPLACSMTQEPEPRERMQ